MHRLISLGVFFLLLGGSIDAQQGTSDLLIPWGTSDQTLGVFQDGDYLRGPSFFDREPDGTIIVADAYKARLARFTSKGDYLGAIPLPEVSPRMTAFKRTSDGTFVVSNDQSLSRWTYSGDSLGARGLGLVLPEGYWFTNSSASAVLSVDRGSVTNEFDRTFQRESQFSLQSGGTQTAALKDEKGGILMARWDAQAKVFGWKAPLPAQAVPVGGLSTGPSLWTDFAEGQRTFWLVDGAGTLRGTRAVAVTSGASHLYSWVSGTQVLVGQWTAAGLLFQEWSLTL